MPVQRFVIGGTTLVLAILIALFVWRALFWLLAHLAKRQEAVWGAVVHRLKRPAAFILPLVAIISALPTLDETIIPHAFNLPFEHVTGLLIIAAFGWAVVAMIGLWSDVSKVRNRVLSYSECRTIGAKPASLRRSLRRHQRLD